MTPEREKKLLSSIYDRLYDAVTYAPDGKAAPFNKNEIVFQMAKNAVIDPSDFANMISPRNPNGDMRAGSVFSDYVDSIPRVGPLWNPTDDKVSKFYGDIVAKANTLTQPTPAQQAIYDKAYRYLNVETKSPPDMDGNTVTTDGPSTIAQTYDDNQTAYVGAIRGYRTAYNSYNLDNIKDQRDWQTAEPALSLNIDKAWNAWVRGGKAQVEQAQSALASSINDAVKHAIEEAQRLTNDSHKFAPMLPGQEKWLPSYAMPTSWAQASSTATKLTFTSAYLNETESSAAHSYGASFNVASGLWHASASAEGSHKEENYHMDAENLTIEAELITVNIMRPWFNPLILRMKSWFVTGFDVNGISNGNPTNLTGAVPLIPTAFVVCRNVKISADFSEKDKQVITDSHKAEASGGWGPFTISAKYGYEGKQGKSSSKFDGATLQLPGLQVIAWVSTITPACPPLAPAAV
jgi:hypothetical protein